MFVLVFIIQDEVKKKADTSLELSLNKSLELWLNANLELPLNKSLESETKQQSRIEIK